MNSMTTHRIALTLLMATVVVLSGCASLGAKQEVVEKAEVVKKGPQTAPHRSITSFSSGLPLGFTAANSLGNYGFQIQRPNVANLGAAKVDNPTPDRWFNTSSFAQPGTFEIGNMTRWAPNIRFGQTRHADFAILKNFRWHEHWKAQFRVEMFNMTNTPQFGRANTTVGSPAFGTVTGTTNVGPRNIQLEGRINF